MTTRPTPPLSGSDNAPDLEHQRTRLRKALRLVSHHIRTLADQRRDVDKAERVIRDIINEALKETDTLP